MPRPSEAARRAVQAIGSGPGEYKKHKHAVECFNSEGVLMAYSTLQLGHKIHQLVEAAERFCAGTGWRVVVK